MFTTCPACRMNLAVTATDLRVGQGYVRCGRCERVFNALMSLSEDLDPEEQSGLAAHGTTTLPAIEDEEAADAMLSGEASSPPAPADNTAVDYDLDVLDSAATGTVETIVLEGDTYLQTEEHLDEEEVEQRLRDITGPRLDRDAVAAASLPPVAVKQAASEPPPEIDADAAVGNPPRAHWAWKVAAVLLLLLLAGQVVHHHRQALVARAWLEKPLHGLYAMFGIDLHPAWDLSAYDLRQLGGEAMTQDSSSIVLRATVQNRATVPQPPPLIRVRLQDRYSNALSTVTLAPADYIKGTVPDRMAPDVRLDAELRLEDPSRQAGSFELDVCLPDAGGTTHCAHDP
jgi:predicted Zn finger-like uncharacterized protein